MCSSDKRFCSSPEHPDWLWGPTSCLLSEHQVLFGLRVKWPEHKSDCTGLKDELSCMSFSPYAFTACTGTVLPSLGIIVHSACKKLEIPCFFDEVDISAIFYLIHV